ncbi:MurR/RpiR family transcriptional regulator [Sharpea azabuensis]|uniref:Transcriptional regulator, RpiR family n=1 Tax=Sharpea azabuensis TaxID=322505 RepID=A0A1H6QVN9_9FIRM|nr:MurR/RpiR family transcriptional regulator [Sharpea azabuensis]SEI47679.1 transcriptional regulator, RpiR family [Sharpea azabuensis]HBG84659.1 MurR/RpiR family transcriptional regulator [Erysipelotrichaceae bacterium]HCG97429.1 MurR/RpiR family transcriptional regulator [Erysipelotrichaceae bacterium]
MHPDLSKLTNKEREAYQFLNTHQQLISYMSLRDIAKQTHISTATILRLITKMGYKSFQEYKFSLKQDESVDLSYDLTEIIKALKHLEDDYYEEKLYEIAGLLKETNAVIFHGIGGSAPIAAYGARKLAETGLFSFSSSDPFFINASMLKQRADIFLSISGNTKEILDLATLVSKDKENGSFSIAITANLSSELAKLCDWTIAYPLTIKRDQQFISTSQLVTVAIIEKLTYLIKTLS